MNRHPFNVAIREAHTMSRDFNTAANDFGDAYTKASNDVLFACAARIDYDWADLPTARSLATFERNAKRAILSLEDATNGPAPVAIAARRVLVHLREAMIHAGIEG